MNLIKRISLIATLNLAGVVFGSAPPTTAGEALGAETEFGVTLDGAEGFRPCTIHTLGECVVELLDVSCDIYQYLLHVSSQKGPLTLVCGGQSPAYYCLAIFNSDDYDSDRVDIVVLPHSKGGIVEQADDSNRKYASLLKGHDIRLRKTVAILDGVHSGTGILALQSALQFFLPIHLS